MGISHANYYDLWGDSSTLNTRSLKDNHVPNLSELRMVCRGWVEPGQLDDLLMQDGNQSVDPKTCTALRKFCIEDGFFESVDDLKDVFAIARLSSIEELEIINTLLGPLAEELPGSLILGCASVSCR